MEPSDVVDIVNKINYKKGKLLGKGGFARCYEFRDPNDHILAGKVVPKSGINNKNNKEKLYQEIRIHQGVHHENIVAFVACLEDEKNVYILLELCTNKTLLELHKRRGKITEPETRYYSRQIACACSYLHNSRIIHRDLKLANIFLNENMKVKIGDFGLASKLESDTERRRTMCGTPNYIAPEILRKEGHSYEVDMWSLGCIVFTLLVGKPPFETSTLRETYTRIRNNEYSIPNTVSTSAQEVIRALLEKQPERRPSMTILTQCYPFFREFTPNVLPQSALTTEPRFDTVNSGFRPLPFSALKNTTNILPIISGIGVTGGVSPAISGDNNHIQRDIEYLNKLKYLITAVVNDGKRLPPLVGDTKADVACMDESEDPNLAPVFWVSKWVDYSDRYGLGYQLSDGSNGVVFNDISRIILANDNTNLQYVERDGTERLHTMTQFPQKLEKKFTLLNYFRTYMNENLMTAGENMRISNKDSMIRLPYVKAWFRTKNTVVFYLNNGTLQANMLADHRKLILCPLLDAVTCLDGADEFKTLSLASLVQNGVTDGMRKRLQYCLKLISKVYLSLTRVDENE